MSQFTTSADESRSHEQLLTHVLSICEQQQQAAGLHLLYHYRAAARFKQGKHAAAVQDARTALSIQASFTPASCCCAAALLELGRAADAAQVAQRALQLDPSSTDAQALLARALAAVTSGVQQIPQQVTPVSQPPKTLPADVFPAGLGPASRHMFRASPDGFNTNLLLMLHGLGDTPKPYAALAARMALPQTATLALAGPMEVPETDGGRAWFQAFDEEWELIEPSPGEQRRASSLDNTVELLVELIRRLVAAGWRHRCIHFVGFSQGGTTALEVNWQLRGKERLGGCVSVAGAMLEEMQWQRKQRPTAGGNGDECGPVLITLGDRDSTTSKASVDATLQLLQQSGVHGSCRMHSVPGKAHGMVASEVEMRALMTFWAETLAARPPGEGVVELT